MFAFDHDTVFFLILLLIQYVNGQYEIINGAGTNINCQENDTLFPDGCQIYCSDTQSCNSITISCEAKCDIMCNANNSCEDSTININPDISMNLYCNAAQSCTGIVLHGADANLVNIVCSNADCNGMDVYCPVTSTKTTNTINCMVNCAHGVNNCADNEYYIPQNNFNDIQFQLNCDDETVCTNNDLQCDYDIDEDDYQQSCSLSYINSKWKCDDTGCNGPYARRLQLSEEENKPEEFLAGWAASTIVFIIMMVSGSLIVFGILIIRTKESYDKYKKGKEKQRKKENRTNAKQQIERRRSMHTPLPDADDVSMSGNHRNMYSKGHKLSGSYYVSPKKNKKISFNDEYESKKPPNIEILDEMNEESYSYELQEPQPDDHESNTNLMNIIEESDMDDNEESKSYSLHSVSSKSTKSQSKDTKNKNKNKHKSYAKSSLDLLTYALKYGKKKEKKRRPGLQRIATPIQKENKMDTNPPTLIINSIGEDHDNDNGDVIIQVKTKKKHIKSPKNKKKNKKKSVKSPKNKKKNKKKKSDNDEYSSDSSYSQKRSKKKSKKGANRVTFKDDIDKKSNSKKKSKRKKKTQRSKSRPLNKISGVIMPKKLALAETKSLDTDEFRRKKGVKRKDKQRVNSAIPLTYSKSKSKSKKRKSKKDKDRKKSAPVNKFIPKQKNAKLHRKTNSLINLRSGLKKIISSSASNSDLDGAGKRKPKLRNKQSQSKSKSKSDKKRVKSSTKEKIAGLFVKKDEPQLIKTKSSPLFRQQKAHTYKDFIWDTFYASQVYGGCLLHAWDIATDFSVIIYWIEIGADPALIGLSCMAVFLYRIVSSVVLAKQFGWQWGIIQFLDLTVYVEAYRSLRNHYCTYTRELNWIRRMEAIFESSPQALLQLGYLMMSSDVIGGDINDSFGILVILSFVSSLTSIAFSVVRDDAAYFITEAMDFTVPVWKSKLFKQNSNDNNNNKKGGKHKKKDKKHKNKKGKKNKKNNKKQLHHNEWIAREELKSCYNDPENYIHDVETIWIPNLKYIIRFLFRLCEATARIFTLVLFWMSFGGLLLGILVIMGLLFYFLLQITGLIGFEWGNMITFLIVHPNLTLKTDLNKTDRAMLTKIVTIISGWYIIAKSFSIDMVQTHYIHRTIETITELTIICIFVYGLDCCGTEKIDSSDSTNVTYYNTIDVLSKPIGISILVVAILCTIATPLLHRIVSFWLKKGQSLENNLFGLIQAFDQRAVENFLIKSNRTEQLLNSSSPRGYTPLSLAVEVGFYSILDILLKYGADINQINKKGESAAHIIAKSSSLSKKNMIKFANKLKKLNLNFSLLDKLGWPPCFHACEIGNVKFINWLSQNDVDALCANDFDERKLSHIACVHNRYSFLNALQLLKKKKKLKTDLFSSKDEDGKIPLHYAFEHQSMECIKILINKNRDSINIQDNNGETSLNIAAQYFDSSCFQRLKSINITKYIKFRIFLNPICIEGNISTLKWCLKECQRESRIYKPLQKYRDPKNQRNPLHFCCMHGNHELIPILKKYKFPVDATDYKGRTPAYFAAQRGHIDCLKILAKSKANFKIMSSNRKKPIKIAKENGHNECVKFLNKYE